MELWDLYTAYREKIGVDQVRGEPIPEDCYHSVVHVWIRNRKGEYLIAQRSKHRPSFPLMWECVGGSVLKGECSLDGAVREVWEEVGIKLNPESGTLLFSKVRDRDDLCTGEIFRDILDVWLFSYDGAVSLTNALTDEVADCRFAELETIRELLDAGQFVPTLNYCFCVLDTPAPEVRDLIGKTVCGTVIRQIELPCYPQDLAPINPVFCGLADIADTEGKKQMVYWFGPGTPRNCFSGVVIAVWHRFNDTENRWIVTSDGNTIPDEKILGAISFQERLFYGKLYR